jgi:hypothetical protein
MNGFVNLVFFVLPLGWTAKGASNFFVIQNVVPLGSQSCIVRI